MATRPPIGTRIWWTGLDRQFVADRPNALSVTDLTYVPTWAISVNGC